MPFLYGDNLYYYVIQPRRFFWSHASNKTTYHHHVCTRGKLRGSFCLQMGELRALQPPRFLKAMDACKKTKQGSGRRQHRCLHQKTSIRSSPCGSFMFALGESYAGHFVCKWGGCTPPNPPFFKGHGCLKLPHFHSFYCFS